MSLTVASLTAKRADLQSQLEQYVGQINRINGAVAVLDDLILELGEAAEQAVPPTAANDTSHWGIHEGDAPPTAPEMLPVSYDAVS